MKKTNKILAVFMALTLVFLAACNNTKDADPAVVPQTTDTTADPNDPFAVVIPTETRTIRIGTWYDEYYDSTHDSIYANPQISDEFRAQTAFDNLKVVEDRYNVRFQYVNLTWEGCIESINTSIMAGAPDCDIYMVDLQFGIPAVLNGYAQSLNSFLPADNDVLTDQIVLKHLNILDDANNYLFTPQARNAEGYPLGFNVDMIKAANLEDPRDLYDRGEWTWDVWKDYLIQLTQDVDGDGVTDIYGYGGYWTNMLENMLSANNTYIAGSMQQGLDDPATLEVFQFFHDIYQVDKTARPWIEEDWEVNLRPFTDGIMAFFVIKDWIVQNFASSGEDLSYELGVVPWPYGPNGTKEDSQKFVAAGNWHIVPVGVSDPALVYAAYFDYINWFDYDVEWRDEGGMFDWQAEQYLNERNFQMAIENGAIPSFDLWEKLGTDFSMVPILNGEKTPAQHAEESRQIIQEALDIYFGS